MKTMNMMLTMKTLLNTDLRGHRVIVSFVNSFVRIGTCN